MPSLVAKQPSSHVVISIVQACKNENGDMDTAEGAFRRLSLIHDLSELRKLHVKQPRALGYSYTLPARKPSLRRDRIVFWHDAR